MWSLPKYLVVFLLIFLSGCYTQKKAEKQVNKAQLNHPIVVAKLAAKYYPPILVTTTDSAAYKKYLEQIDELNRFYESMAERVVYDTVPGEIEVWEDSTRVLQLTKTIKSLNGKLQAAYANVAALTEKAKSVPPVVKETTQQDSAKNTYYQEQIAVLTVQRDKVTKKLSDWKTVAFFMLALSFILACLLFVALRIKRSVKG